MLTAFALTLVLTQAAPAATPPIPPAHVVVGDPGDAQRIFCSRFPKLPVCR